MAINWVCTLEAGVIWCVVSAQAECEKAAPRAGRCRDCAGLDEASALVCKLLLVHLHIVLPCPPRYLYPPPFPPLALTMPSDAPVPRDAGMFSLFCNSVLHSDWSHRRFRSSIPLPHPDWQ